MITRFELNYVLLGNGFSHFKKNEEIKNIFKFDFK